jgi:hypothetical protein
MFWKQFIPKVEQPDDNGFKTATTRLHSLKVGGVYQVWTGGRFNPERTDTIVRINTARKVAPWDYSDEMLIKDVGHDDVGTFVADLQRINNSKHISRKTEMTYHEFSKVEAPALEAFA